MSEVLELATFGVVAGVSTDEVVAAARSADPWIAAQPGFRSRVLVGPDPDGRFTDVIRWRSYPDAQAAAERMTQEESVRPFLAIIDAARVELRHAPVVWAR